MIHRNVLVDYWYYQKSNKQKQSINYVKYEVVYVCVLLKDTKVILVNCLYYHIFYEQTRRKQKSDEFNKFFEGKCRIDMRVNNT